MLVPRVPVQLCSAPVITEHNESAVGGETEAKNMSQGVAKGGPVGEDCHGGEMKLQGGRRGESCRGC